MIKLGLNILGFLFTGFIGAHMLPPNNDSLGFIIGVTIYTLVYCCVMEYLQSKKF